MSKFCLFKNVCISGEILCFFSLTWRENLFCPRSPFIYFSFSLALTLSSSLCLSWCPRTLLNCRLRNEEGASGKVGAQAILASTTLAYYAGDEREERGFSLAKVASVKAQNRLENTVTLSGLSFPSLLLIVKAAKVSLSAFS